jgi:hypothetical protein
MKNLSEEKKRILEDPIRLGHYLGYKDLVDTHGDWIHYCYGTGPKESPLQAFRGSFKTTSISVVGIIWYHLFNPEDRILICRKEHAAAVGTLWEIKQQYEGERLRNLYREWFKLDDALDRSKSREDVLLLKRKKKITKEPSIMAMGIQGSVTGWHFDVIDCDDITTIKDRYSKAEREKTKEGFQELRRVVMPGGRIVVTGTPQHPADVFCLMTEPKKYPIGSVNIKTVTPEWIEEERRKMNNISLWAANMELKHIADEDRIFKEPTFAPWPDLPCIAVLDPAYDGDCNTALAIGGIDREKKRIFVRGYSWRASVVDKYDAILNALQLYKCGTLFVEKNADKGMSARDLYQKRGGLVQSYTEIQNKHWRIIHNIQKNWSLIDFASDCDETFLSEVLEYNELEGYNDAPDALAGLLRILLTPQRKKPEVKYVGVS